MKNLQLRINGIAPAWPLLLEYPHPFYPQTDTNRLGSASYSLIQNDDRNNVISEILIDAGHNTVPFLIRNGNRIPDGVILTHGHADHILGLDWIVQSRHYKNPDRHYKLPVYCTKGVWETVMKSYPYLEPLTEYRQFLPGVKADILEMGGLQVTPYPVFHGRSTMGATMLFIEDSDRHKKPLIITGDLLCPLLRRKDWENIARAGVLCIDTNNRFPLPESNHTSFARNNKGNGISRQLKEWFDEVKITDLILPHLERETDEANSYFDEFVSDWNSTSEIPHTILDVLKLAPVPEVYLMHYFGIYDEIHFGEKLLSEADLKKWANRLVSDDGNKNISVHVPSPGDLIHL